jgi:tetratricopeptide (TPR) repeat protein
MDRKSAPLRQARLSAGWSQEQAIVRFEALSRVMGIAAPTRSSLRTLLSVFENGHRQAPKQYWPVFRELYRATDIELGFQTSLEFPTLPAVPQLPIEDIERPTPEVIAYLTNIRAEHARADTLLGPRYLVAPVQSQMPLIERLCQAARSSERQAILYIGARFAEFCGWLYQDLGYTDSAIYWTDFALDYAAELGDARLIAYTLHRKSNIVTESGSPGHGLGLANAALRVSGPISPRIRAAALRQKARAHALLSEAAQFAQAIDGAMASASQEDAPDNPARFCTPSYVEMEAGISWLKLGKVDVATNVFRESLRTWPENAQIRDRGLCLSRLGTALAMEGDVDEAFKIAVEASDIAHSTGSARIGFQLAECVQTLRPQAERSILEELEHQISDSSRRVGP